MILLLRKIKVYLLFIMFLDLPALKYRVLLIVRGKFDYFLLVRVLLVWVLLIVHLNVDWLADLVNVLVFKIEVDFLMILDWV